MNIRENVLDVTKEPLAGGSITNLCRLLAQNRLRIDFIYLPRVLYSIILNIITAPFRIVEKMKFDGVIKNTEIKHDPVFIIGHWRTGTTYLHNLLSLDKNLSFFSTFHAYAPGVILGSEKVFRPILVYSLPEKRPMDNVAMEADLPQEDEYAVGAFSPYSYYQGWCFPRNMEFYNRFVCMEEVSKKVIEEWKEVYQYLLRKVTLCRNGKQLVLKNPANTARVKLLLEMFPKAKFILMCRNPYHMYFSMMKFIKIVIPLYCVQKPPKVEELEKLMMALYTQMFKKYLEEKEYIPEGNLIEVKYEDFIQEPLKELKRIYTALDMEGFKESEKIFKEYTASQAFFMSDRYEMKKDIKEKIYKQWKFVFDALGYEK